MKVIFEYSQPLDAMLTEMSLRPFYQKQVLEMIEYKNSIENNWRKIEKKVIDGIEFCSGLKFKGNITCFVVKFMEYKAISSPLIIRKEKSTKYMEIIIMHELIHMLLSENKELVANYINAIYPNRDHDFKIHIPVLLIQRKVMELLLSKEEIEKFLREDADNLQEEWKEASKYNYKYKNNIVSFLENENLE